MKRIAIILFTIFTWNFGFSQSVIELPNFEYVQVDYDLRDYVSISVNKSGEIRIENKLITLEELGKNLFQELNQKTKFEGLRLPIAIIELIVDKELEFKQLEHLLTELRKLSFLKVHFACNSEKEKRTKDLKTTGFLYKLNSIEDSNSIILEVRDSLNSELERIFKSKGKDIDEFEKSKMPPPPPPPPEVTALQLKNGELNINFKEIIISNNKYIIENQEFTFIELKNQITKWNSEKPIAYILNPTEQCKYEMFLSPIAILNQVLQTLWKKESLKKFNKDYEKLEYAERRKIRNAFPFLIVIDD